MNLYVLLKMVPDTVEELNVGSDNRSLDTEFLRFKLSDPDEHALEQGMLLKERHRCKVTVVGLDSPEVDDALFTAAAKGADRLVKLSTEAPLLPSYAAARLLAQFIAPQGDVLAPDTLILIRSQAIDDLEGEVGAYLASALGVPYVSVVTGVVVEGNQVRVTKEFAGGLRGEFTSPLPVVLGIQSAEKPPRYVPIAKVRAAMKTAKIESIAPPGPEPAARFTVERMYKPEAAGHAQMIEGTAEEMAARLVEVMVQQHAI
jgi:electron transfer flavoprotein beta subunit